jgi:hypothetical protein
LEIEYTSFQESRENFWVFPIDLFASFNNNQLLPYFSWFSGPGALAVDAFKQIWPISGAYAFPPFNLIARVLPLKVQQGCSLIFCARGR